MLKSLNLTLVLGLVITPISGEEISQYTVYFWKIPCVDITMTESRDNLSNNHKITFLTKTTGFFSLLFPVNNRYTTTYDTTTFQFINFHKKIVQKNVEQELTIEWNKETQSYHSGKIEYVRSGNTHNVFSLLMRGRSTPFDSLDTKWWKMDHEGKLYKARYLWIDSVNIELNGNSFLTDHYRIDLIPVDETPTQLIEKTDVFMWGIALNNNIRQIWIERSGKRRILRAEVKVLGFTLTAEMKNE